MLQSSYIYSIGQRIFHRKILYKKLMWQCIIYTIEQAVHHSKYQITSRYPCHIKEIKTRRYFNHIGWIFGTNCHVIFYCILSCDVVTHKHNPLYIYRTSTPSSCTHKTDNADVKKMWSSSSPFIRILILYSIHVRVPTACIDETKQSCLRSALEMSWI